MKFLLFVLVVNALGQELVFECNFDDGKCANGPFSFNDSNLSIIDQQKLNDYDYYITDLSSITQLTLNNQTCQIPFYKYQTEYYHCAYENKFICPTTSGDEDQCSLGKFLLGKTEENAMPISLRATSSEIVLPEEGNYEINFYVYMYTKLLFISSGRDLIKASLFYSSNKTSPFTSEVYNYTSFGRPNSWIKKSFQFRAFETNINIVFDFVRTEKRTQQGYFGIDHIEIIKLNQTPTTTPTTSLTSTENTTESTQTETTHTPTWTSNTTKSSDSSSFESFRILTFLISTFTTFKIMIF